MKSFVLMMYYKNEKQWWINSKNRIFYFFDDTMRVGDFDFDNILFDKKSYNNSSGNILIYGILYKTFMGAKPLRIRFDNIDGFIQIYDRLDIKYYLVLKDMMQFILRLDIL